MRSKWLKKAGVIMAFSVFGLLALGSGSSSAGNEKAITTETGSGTEEGADTEGVDVKETSNTGEAANGKATIDKQVLVEENGLKITAIELVEDSIWGKGIKLLIENDSDKNMGVGCNALIVNDYMLTDLFASSVAAGKKANETLYVSSNQLEAAGISNIGQIEIYFHVYDSDSYETLFDAAPVTIQTSEYGNMDTETTVEGAELYNQDGVRIVGRYVDEDSFWGTAVLLYIENTSGKNIGVSCDNMSVNGFMVTPLFSSTVYDGKKSFDDITIFASDLEENGIESVENIELTFHIYDADSYNTICDTEPISFSTK